MIVRISSFTLALAVLIAGVPAQSQQSTAPAPASAPAATADAAEPALLIKRENVLARYGFVQIERRLLTPSTGVGRVYATTIAKSGVESMRFHFSVEVSADEWIIQISRFIDGEDVVAWTQTSAAEEVDFWSDEIPGSRARIEILSFRPDTPLRIRLLDILPKVPVSSPLSISEPDQRWPLRVIPPDASADVKTHWKDFERLGKAVVRLRFVGDDGVGYYCTGFMITKNLLLTNDHCMKSDNEIRSTLVDFDYLSTTSRLRTEQIKAEVARSADLDYALYRLRRSVDVTPLRLTLANAPAIADKQQLLIIEHPSGEPKQVSILDCVVKHAEVTGVTAGQKTDFGHLCDTKGGSSGSPVFDSLTSGVVTGLHHFGFTKGIADPVNQAVRMQLIRSDIEQRYKNVAAEIP